MRALAAGALVGLVVGLVVAFLQPVRYRAHASVVVAPALKRTDPALATMTQTVAALARSDAVAQNVVLALHLNESPGALRGDLHAHAVRGSALVDISADQPSSVGAERTVQQAVVVLQRLAAARLSGVVPGQLVVWDAAGGTAHALGRPFAAWCVGGASVGFLIAGLGLLAPRRRGAPRLEAGTEPEVLPAPEPEPAAEEQPEPEPPPEPEPLPERKSGQVAELERRAHAEPDGARQAEMLVYLDQLAPFADAEGNLPANLVGLAEDVFGPLA